MATGWGGTGGVYRGGAAAAARPAAAARRSPGRRSLVHTAPLHGEFLYAVTPFVASLQVIIL